MELGCCLQLLWLRVLMSRWFNVEIVDDFSSDELSVDDEDEDEDEEEEDEEEYALSDQESEPSVPVERLRILVPITTRSNQQQAMVENEFLTTEQLRIAVGTWNVAGRTPPPHLDLMDWLESNGPADIYVVGFQEIVPLNVGNVCGVDDVEPAIRWQGLIRDTLNRPESSEDEVDWNSMKEKTTSIPPIPMDNCYDESKEIETPLLSLISGVPSTFSVLGKKQARYVRVASKQMVGIHISVWVRRKLCRCIHSLSVSCVGLGLMGCLGNKGSVSVSMRLHQTSFCFICSHLTSGDKGGDEERRNWDALEILKRTHFPHSTTDSLRCILGHDRIIWLGDLNYRIDLMENEIRLLVGNEDWTGLFKKDQLKKQSRKGHIFEGWHEGSIAFAPTYKYEFDSKCYAGENLKLGEKRRSPAWCDRVIWHGKGLKLLTYKRGESMFSDHRPVIAVFTAEVELSQKVINDRACKNGG